MKSAWFGLSNDGEKSGEGNWEECLKEEAEGNSNCSRAERTSSGKAEYCESEEEEGDEDERDGEDEKDEEDEEG